MRSAESVLDSLYDHNLHAERARVISGAQREAVHETQDTVAREDAAAMCPKCAERNGEPPPYSFTITEPSEAQIFLHEDYPCPAMGVWALHAKRVAARS